MIDFSPGVELLQTTQQKIHDLPRGTSDAEMAKVVVDSFKSPESQARLSGEQKIVRAILSHMADALEASASGRDLGSRGREDDDFEVRRGKYLSFENDMYFAIMTFGRTEDVNQRQRFQQLVRGVWDFNSAMVQNSQFEDVSGFKKVRDLQSGVRGLVAVHTCLEQQGYMVDLATKELDKVGIDFLVYKNEQDYDAERPFFYVDAKSKVQSITNRFMYADVRYAANQKMNRDYYRVLAAEYCNANLPVLEINYPSELSNPEFYENQTFGFPNEMGMDAMAPLVSEALEVAYAT